MTDRKQVVIGDAVTAKQPLVVFTRSFRARPASVRRTLIELSRRLCAHISMDLMGRSELVLAEVLNNIAQHGRAQLAGPRPLVHLSVVAQHDGLSCSVCDDGGLLPRLCLDSKLPDPASHPEGGFGWFLIGHLTQSLAYFREDGRNFVAFTVPIHPPEPS
ncbi:MAG: ATP-binding protein [Paracoccus sp. (in: a-proteobacteria)]|nr:ATP-binding protein [Paracoccus sp. (in: a-proteobacteria)]